MSTLILALDVLIGLAIVVGVLGVGQILIDTSRWGKS